MGYNISISRLVPPVNSTKDWNEKRINSEHHRKNYSIIHCIKIFRIIAILLGKNHKKQLTKKKIEIWLLLIMVLFTQSINASQLHWVIIMKFYNKIIIECRCLNICWNISSENEQKMEDCFSQQLLRQNVSWFLS